MSTWLDREKEMRNAWNQVAQLGKDSFHGIYISHKDVRSGYRYNTYNIVYGG